MGLMRSGLSAGWHWPCVLDARACRGALGSQLWFAGLERSDHFRIQSHFPNQGSSLTSIVASSIREHSAECREVTGRGLIERTFGCAACGGDRCCHVCECSDCGCSIRGLHSADSISSLFLPPQRRTHGQSSPRQGTSQSRSQKATDAKPDPTSQEIMSDMSSRWSAGCHS